MSKKYSTFVPDDQNGYKQYNWFTGFEKKYDRPDSDTVYVGLCVPGTLTSAAGWMIYRAKKVNNEYTVTFAGNDCKKFDRIWDNRATYNY